VETDPEAVEAVSEILARVAPGGVAVEPAFTLSDEGLGAVPDPTRPAIVRAWLSALDTGAAETAIAQTEERLGHLQAFGLRPIGALHVRPVHEEDWAHAWKDHFPVLRVGRRLVIRPTWRDHDPAADDVVLALDPGMAFGTGLHPTTRLCLAGVERWADDGLTDAATCLDVGCGSGILTVAAARLGAASVLAVDTDPIAVEATLRNAAGNGVSGRITTRRGSLPQPEGPFDLVMANLIASLLVDLAGALASSLRPPASGRMGGRLLASGIYIDREADVREAFALAGLHTLRREQETDWVALEATPLPSLQP
jgi:ribosomal protein L11 methyltransferase